MIYIPFLILLAAAACCLVLNRFLGTRVLGYGAAVAALVAGVALVVIARRAPLPIERTLLEWVIPGMLAVPVRLRLDTPSLALGALILFGGAVLLLALAGALARSLRGFGNLFALALLVLVASLAALCCATPILLPYLWALVALASFAATWASGVLGRQGGVPPGAAYTLLAGLLLFAGLIPSLAETNTSGALFTGPGAIACVVLAVLMASGMPPFRAALDAPLAAPPALSGLLSGLGLPLVALATVWRLLAETTNVLSDNARFALALIGLLGLLVSAAGALREHGLKALLGWQLGGQAGVVLLALSLYRPDINGANSGMWALLSNLVLSSGAGMLALAVLERKGSDDFTAASEAGGARSLRLAGVVWALAGASAVGLPPLWGFWGRQWLIETALIRLPWAVPLLLAGSTLALLAYVAPLAAFLRPADASQTSAKISGIDWIALCGLLPVAVCLLLGVAPELAWPLPLAVGRVEQAICVALLLASLVLLVLARRRPLGRLPLTDPDMSPVVLAPDALGDSARPLGWIGRPSGLMDFGWRMLMRLGEIVQIALLLFERRYYLAGLLLGLIVMILLMAQ